MLPMKLELTEELAATLRQLRLDHPVNGEVLTAENLSKAIGNNRAWMSQIESRRLKKIRREDIIKIYKLLFNENDDHKAEDIAEMDLYLLKDSFSLEEKTIVTTIDELKDILMHKYNNFSTIGDKGELLSCIKTLTNNFKCDYKHAKDLYSVDIECCNLSLSTDEKIIQKYSNELNDICINYRLSVNLLNRNAQLASFSTQINEIYKKTLEKIEHINTQSSVSEIMPIIETIDNFSQNLFLYINMLQLNQNNWNIAIDTNNAYNALLNMLTALSSKVNPNYNFSLPKIFPGKDESALSKIQLEISNILMELIKKYF